MVGRRRKNPWGEKDSGQEEESSKIQRGYSEQPDSGDDNLPDRDQELIASVLEEELSHFQKEPTEREWQSVFQRLPRRRRRFFPWRAASVAAAILLMLVGGAYLFQKYFPFPFPLEAPAQPEEQMEAVEEEEAVERDPLPEAEEEVPRFYFEAAPGEFIEESRFSLMVPAHIGEYRYQETLPPSTRELAYLLYSSQEGESSGDQISETVFFARHDAIGGVGTGCLEIKEKNSRDNTCSSSLAVFRLPEDENLLKEKVKEAKKAKGGNIGGSGEESSGEESIEVKSIEVVGSQNHSYQPWSAPAFTSLEGGIPGSLREATSLGTLLDEGKTEENPGELILAKAAVPPYQEREDFLAQAEEDWEEDFTPVEAEEWLTEEKSEAEARQFSREAPESFWEKVHEREGLFADRDKNLLMLWWLADTAWMLWPQQEVSIEELLEIYQGLPSSLKR